MCSCGRHAVSNSLDMANSLGHLHLAWSKPSMRRNTTVESLSGPVSCNHFGRALSAANLSKKVTTSKSAIINTKCFAWFVEIASRCCLVRDCFLNSKYRAHMVHVACLPMVWEKQNLVPLFELTMEGARAGLVCMVRP